jgi:glucose-6-phosphate dehydrogenase assembly protein OpcA
VRECLAEELRRLDPDEIYHAALQSMIEVEGRRTGAAKGSRSVDARRAP